MGAPRAISLFSGAGGLDLGFEQAGFEIGVAVEMDTNCVATLRANREWPVVAGDIHSVTSRKLLRTASLRVGEADLLIGGPPCQPFSKAGYWARGDTLRLDDPRAGTLEAYLRVLRDTLPKTFLLENVPGLAYRGKSEGLELLKRTIDLINSTRRVRYSVTVEQLNAACYGVPQVRERVFVVGSREGHSFTFPRPTHVNPSRLLPIDAMEPFTTAWDAIGDLQGDDDPTLRIRGKWADLLPSIPEGSNYLWHTERGGGLPLFGWRRRYWTFLLKLAKAFPASTIQAQPGPSTGPFHWKNRRLSPTELCRLQTFPEGYRILGGLGAVQKQLGNAVPSALAEILARGIRRQLLSHRVAMTSSLIPTRKGPAPPPEKPQSVPERYLELAGTHEAHPGTGRGPAALKRLPGE